LRFEWWRRGNHISRAQTCEQKTLSANRSADVWADARRHAHSRFPAAFLEVFAP
jgi:hypothetical protein